MRERHQAARSSCSRECVVARAVPVSKLWFGTVCLRVLGLVIEVFEVPGAGDSASS
jgi:hypothetical protein